MKIPESKNTINNLIDTYHESMQEKPRPHMGCSMLGHSCERWLWLSFRWAVIDKFPGRVLRLFRRGHMEEITIVKDLQAIGIDIRATVASQSRVDFGNHLSGSLDGIIHSGVPEARNTKHLAEFKTASDKKFKEFTKKGLEKANYQYYVQCQVYMRGAALTRALFLVVNKNDDSIYTERVRYDAAVADKYIKRGHRLVSSPRLPEPMSADPSWYECKWCAAYSLCHKGEGTTEVNCRTCAHSTPTEDSEWHCDRHSGAVPVQFQREGCKSHAIHPDLVPDSWTQKDSPHEWSAVYDIDGREVINGEDGHLYSELLANLDACLSDDPELEGFKKMGKVVA